MNRRIVLSLVCVLAVSLFLNVEFVLAEGNVGVSVGQSIEYTYAFSATERYLNGTLNSSLPFNVGYVETITIQEISGTNVTLQTVRTPLDGTEETEYWWVDLSTGDGNAYRVIIPADINAGEMVYPDWINENQTTQGADMVNETVLMKLGDNFIEANHMALTFMVDGLPSYWDYYWEKSTGLIVKYTIIGTELTEDGLTRYLNFDFHRIGLQQVFYPFIDSVDYPVIVDSNSAIMAFEFNQTERKLSLDVSGTTGTSGFCDISVPSDLVWGTFSLNMDGYPLAEGNDYTQTHNGTHYIFHVSYIHSTHTIEIVSSDVTSSIPEPSGPTRPQPGQPIPSQSEPKESTSEEPFITTENAIILVVAVACIIGVVSFLALRKRK
jgi:hypothetical protein